MYGGECVHGNFVPCRGDKSGWILKSTVTGSGDDLGHWTANVTFEGDDNPPGSFGAAFASPNGTTEELLFL